MGSDWISVYETDQLYKAELIKRFLSDNEITACVLNQQDYAYKFGSISICVQKNCVIKAKHLLNSVEL